MAEQGYMLTGDAIDRVKDVVERVETDPEFTLGQDGPRPSRTSQPLEQWLQITNATPSGGRYPGQLYLRDASGDSYGTLGSCSVKSPNGDALSTGKYYFGRASGLLNDGSIEFVVIGADAGGSSSPTLTCYNTDGSDSSPFLNVDSIGAVPPLQFQQAFIPGSPTITLTDSFAGTALTNLTHHQLNVSVSGHDSWSSDPNNASQYANWFGQLIVLDGSGDATIASATWATTGAHTSGANYLVNSGAGDGTLTVNVKPIDNTGNFQRVGALVRYKDPATYVICWLCPSENKLNIQWNASGTFGEVTTSWPQSAFGKFFPLTVILSGDTISMSDGTTTFTNADMHYATGGDSVGLQALWGNAAWNSFEFLAPGAMPAAGEVDLVLNNAVTDGNSTVTQVGNLAINVGVLDAGSMSGNDTVAGDATIRLSYLYAYLDSSGADTFTSGSPVTPTLNVVTDTDQYLGLGGSGGTATVPFTGQYRIAAEVWVYAPLVLDAPIILDLINSLFSVVFDGDYKIESASFLGGSFWVTRLTIDKTLSASAGDTFGLFLDTLSSQILEVATLPAEGGPNSWFTIQYLGK